MTMKLETFDFNESPVRVMIRDNAPWFIATDVCRVLEIVNSRDAGSRLDADEKGVALTDTRGGQQNTIIINESGLYTLILRCDDAIKAGTTAYRFRKWVTSEVLPSLRKSGAYALAQEAERDVRAERMEDVRCEVARGLRDVNDMARYAQEEGALRRHLPMDRVRALHTLGRLRLDALRMLWEMECGGMRAMLCANGTRALATEDDDLH